MRWGGTECFPVCCINLCVVILHWGVHVRVPLVWGLNMFPLEGNKSRILHELAVFMLHLSWSSV